MTLKPRLVTRCGVVLALAFSEATALAQAIETVGTRALGMGGAFVAVASDSSATWWNPGALPSGPFVDVTLATAHTEIADVPLARRERTLSMAFMTPPFGLSYYRFRVTDAAGTGLRASQLGLTLVHSLASGVHAGTTLKYVRGTLSGGQQEGQFDIDAGVLAVTGGLRAGVLIKHLRQPRFVGGGNGAGARNTVQLDRQARVGVAFDGPAVGGPPLVLSMDADVSRISTLTGERRNVAIGAEHWVLNRRVGIRAGGRVNTVGRQERTATAGLSVAARSGLFLETYFAHGGSSADRGWGAAARVSF